MIDLPLQLALPGVYLVGVRAGQVPSWTLPLAVVATAAQFGIALFTIVGGDTAAAVGQGFAAGLWAQAAWELWRRRPRRHQGRSSARVVDLGHRLAAVAAR